MQSFVDFLVNNYLWFLVISLVLVFALIGYLVDTNESKNDKLNENQDINIENDDVTLNQTINIINNNDKKMS